MNALLESLLDKNEVERSELEEKLYRTLILGVFTSLCKEIEKNGTKSTDKVTFMKFTDKGTAAENIIRNHHIDCKFTDDEYQLIGTYLMAFFKKSTRDKKFYDVYNREELLKKQECKCAVCKTAIDLSTAELDHIVPHKYVGDELENNAQLLCKTCNTRKGKSISFELDMLLLNQT